MNKLLNYGLGTLIGFSMVLPACTGEKTGIRQQAEKLSTWHTLIDENQKMSQKEKDQAKLLTANSEFHVTDENYLGRGPLLMTDSSVTGQFIKNGDTVAWGYLHKTMLVFGAESQALDSIATTWREDKKITWKQATLLNQNATNKYVDGHRSTKENFYFIPH